MAKTVNPVWQQQDYAFYQDGTESGATLIGSAGAQQTLDTDTVYHCRLAIAETAGATESPALTLLWQYNHQSGGWLTITGATPVQFVDNANLTDGGATTNRDPSGGGTFVAGRIYETANTSATCYTSSGSDHTEALLHFQIDSAQVSHGDEILIRCVEGGGTVFGGAYTNADINVNEAATTYPGTGVFTGGASLSASGALYKPGTATFSGGASLAAVGALFNGGTASFTGGASFTAADWVVNRAGTASFTGGASLVGIGAHIGGSTTYPGVGTFTGGASLSATGVQIHVATASFTGGASFSSVGSVVRAASASFTGGASLGAVGVSVRAGTASFTGGASLVGNGLHKPAGGTTYPGVAGFTGGGLLSAVGETVRATKGGIRRRRRRQFVEIDGRMIEVSSMQEAIELLALFRYEEEEEQEEKIKKRRIRVKPTKIEPAADFVVYSDREVKRQKFKNFVDSLRYEQFKAEIKRERDDEDVLMLLVA